ncbi:hypothetical protein DXU02_31240 [Rhizobium leguminosarum]|jgi:hypothetical protein
MDIQGMLDHREEVLWSFAENQFPAVCIVNLIKFDAASRGYFSYSPNAETTHCKYHRNTA